MFQWVVDLLCDRYNGHGWDKVKVKTTTEAMSAGEAAEKAKLKIQAMDQSWNVYNVVGIHSTDSGPYPPNWKDE